MPWSISSRISSSRALRRGLGALLFAWLAAGCSAVQAMDWNALGELARQRAQAPFQPVGDKLPADLAALDYDQMRDIRFRTERSLWRDQSLPFEAQFFHLGLYQKQAVRLHELAPEGVADLPYRSAIDTVGGQGEEFPRFTDFWLQRPAPGATEVTVLALLDSPRASGAYRFVIRPGASTTMTVTSRLFLRVGAGPVNTLGLAPLTSMFLHGENQPNANDFRSEVHDSDGLMMHTGDGEWLWRPLQNPAQISVSSFTMRQPRGFGLMQRDRRFASYEDIEARYERRPSAWVRPLGDWGAGRVELVQLRTPDETHDNIVAYWVPATLPAPGQPLDFAYELSWQGEAQQTPPGAWVVQSRRGYGYTKLSASEQQRQPQFVLDFAGPVLEALPADAAVRAVASADANGRIVEALAYPNPTQRGWRVTLRVERLDPARPVELRVFLQHQNNTLSETWTHAVLPE